MWMGMGGGRERRRRECVVERCGGELLVGAWMRGVRKKIVGVFEGKFGSAPKFRILRTEPPRARACARHPQSRVNLMWGECTAVIFMDNQVEDSDNCWRYPETGPSAEDELGAK